LAAAHALDRHVALVGFMGAGKTTLGAEVAIRLGRRFVDLDREIERELRRSIPELFRERGEVEFRLLEAEAALGTLRNERPAVVALGGGAVETPAIRRALADHALTALVEVEPDRAWERVRGGDRPLAQDESEFLALFERRRPLYDEVADARVSSADDVVLAAGGVHVEVGVLGVSRCLAQGHGQIALVTDRRVRRLYGERVRRTLGRRLASRHELAEGEAAKSVEELRRLWEELPLDRSGAILALGGGCVTDLAGFAAATYLRGIDWIAAPTTLVGQVDAAIGGKTAINLPEGKNLVGAFHWPARTAIDPGVLETLPERQRREGMAEVVKTGLLANEPLWELRDDELVRRCAAFKTAICLRDPADEGPRQLLNLGHTFAHALEAAAGYEALSHGEAVALGLLAALRLSGRSTEVVEELLRPRPVPVDRERAWHALQRDKKKTGENPTLVLLGDEGGFTTTVPAADARAALDALIAD
jgi:shikimate kinase/3-dehydroquinate synthase